MKGIRNLLLVIFIFVSCSKEEQRPINEEPKDTTPKIEFEVIESYKHDESFFTQGLVFYNGKLYESTGSPKPVDRSGIYFINYNNELPAVKKSELDHSFFGEGITVLKNRLYWLTWLNKKSFVYDPESFEQIDEFNYETEGWGLTNDGQYLIMSDGSDKLRFIDSTNYTVSKVIQVKDVKGPVNRLNELEYINGSIYANVFETPHIIKIDPITGKVTGQLDLTAIVDSIKKANPLADFMNGIAWDSVTDRIFITGKYWPFMYELQLL